MKLPIDYVMDKMEMFEARALMKYSYYADKDNWEQARLIAYLIAQTNSTKHLDMQEMIPFYWDKKEEESNTSITKEEIDALRKKAKQYIENTNKNG